MTITADLIEDSISDEGGRICTFLCHYPRIVHSEVLRHRPMSHSVSSSRAVPVMRMLGRVVEDPAEPVEWGSNKPGMQAGDQLTGVRLAVVKAAWHGAKWAALGAAYIAAKAGAHKQIANRIIEPWTHTTEIITATEFDNFFALRIHDAADPTIRTLAEKMLEAMGRSIPALLEHEQWHLPLVTAEERNSFHTDVLRKVSAARCARASYLNHDKTAPEIRRDLDLAERLANEQHWSPFEHQATPDLWDFDSGDWENATMHGNLRGWIQGRKLMEALA